MESPVDHVTADTDRGVCQDFAHVMIAIARSWGIPARYVSGYLHVANRTGEHLPDNATHAWVECRLPRLGWIGFDPTNQSLAGEGYIPIAAGRDYRTCLRPAASSTVAGKPVSRSTCRYGRIPEHAGAAPGPEPGRSWRW